jgi:hypothetical protein
MGDMADYYRDIELDKMIDEMFDNRRHSKKLIDTSVWETKTGEKLLISKMESDHLVNCHKMIIRHNFRIEWLPSIERELKKRKIKIPKYSDFYGCDASEIDIC